MHRSEDNDPPAGGGRGGGNAPGRGGSGDGGSGAGGGGNGGRSRRAGGVPGTGRRRHSERSAPPPASPPEPPEEPLYIFTREQARELDRLCTSEFGMPSIVLMENAALGLASVARDVARRRSHAPPRVLVFCGPGNNGGDGLAAVRHLANDGSAVSIVLAVAPEKLAGDAATNLGIARKMGLPITPVETPAGVDAALERALGLLSGGTPELVIDALLGTGIDRPPRGVMASLIGVINEFREVGVPVIAVDVPSGMDADTGTPFLGSTGQPGPVVHATVTVALLGLKPGYMTLAAQEFLGDCLVAPIGAPRSLIHRLGRPMGPEGGSGEP